MPVILGHVCTGADLAIIAGGLATSLVLMGTILAFNLHKLKNNKPKEPAK